MSKIFCSLSALGRLPSFISEALDLNASPLGNLTWALLTTLYLGFGIEAKVRIAGTLIPKLPVADNRRAKLLSKMVQNVFEGTVIGCFLGRPAGPTYLGHANEIFADIVCSCRFFHAKVCRDLRMYSPILTTDAVIIN